MSALPVGGVCTVVRRGIRPPQTAPLWPCRGGHAASMQSWHGRAKRHTLPASSVEWHGHAERRALPAHRAGMAVQRGIHRQRAALLLRTSSRLPAESFSWCMRMRCTSTLSVFCTRSMKPPGDPTCSVSENVRFAGSCERRAESHISTGYANV
eukprot:332401-Chlamydomonas_euryale.AAC.4